MALPGSLGMSLECLRDHRALRASWSPADSLVQVAWMHEVGSPSKWERPGHPQKLKKNSLSFPGEVKQRRALIRHLKAPGTSSPRRTWWLCQTRVSL